MPVLMRYMSSVICVVLCPAMIGGIKSGTGIFEPVDAAFWRALKPRIAGFAGVGRYVLGDGV